MFSTKMMERLRDLALNRLASVVRRDDYYEVAFCTRPSDDYQFRAFVYDEEEMLEISAYLSADTTSVWSRPFEQASFSSSELQWAAFSELLSRLFESSSRIEVSGGKPLISSSCFIEGREDPAWGVSHLAGSERGKRLAQLAGKTFRSGPIPAKD